MVRATWVSHALSRNHEAGERHHQKRDEQQPHFSSTRDWLSAIPAQQRTYPYSIAPV